MSGSPPDLATATGLFVALVGESQKLSPPVRDWLSAAVKRWLSGETLDRALGLVGGPGERRPATKARIELRNASLRKAWRLAEGETPWKKTLALAETIARLDPVYRGHKSGRPPTSELNARLCDARDCYRLPGSLSQIHTICSLPHGEMGVFIVSDQFDNDANFFNPAHGQPRETRNYDLR